MLFKHLIALPRPMSHVQDLLDSTRLFLRRAEQALAAGDPQRGLAACDEILAAVSETIPQEADLARQQSPPADGRREAEARAVLDKRLAEVEGLTLQLQTAYAALEERRVDVFRLVALLTALRRTLFALRQGIELWAEPYGVARELAVEPLSAVRAAREALVAEVPAAAVPALRVALAQGLRAPLRLSGEGGVPEALDAWRAMGVPPRFQPDEAARVHEWLERAQGDDAVEAWRLLDEVEHLVHLAAMSPIVRV